MAETNPVPLSQRITVTIILGGMSTRLRVGMFEMLARVDIKKRPIRMDRPF
jgi:hypothetical protein